MDYDALIRQVQQCTLLNNKIDEIYNHTKALNLIDLNWEEHLTNNPIYKRHLEKKVKYSKGHAVANEKAHVRNIINNNDQYNILVFGQFSLSKNENDYSIVARNCPPLTKIGLSMQEHSELKLHDGGRFFVKVCDPRMCYHCYKYHTSYSIPFAYRNWCILNCQIFDGQKIYESFTQDIQQCMLTIKNFLAVFHMRIFARTTFGESYKISGEIYKVIIFQESALIPPMTLELKLEMLPKIEYPDNKEDVERS